MFDQTFKAMDAMDNFRAKAIDVMGQNNAIITRADRPRPRATSTASRQQQAREAGGAAITGPVAL